MYHRSALIEKNCSFRLMADKRKFLIDKYDTVRRRQYLFCPCPAVLSCPGFLGQDMYLRSLGQDRHLNIYVPSGQDMSHVT